MIRWLSIFIPWFRSVFQTQGELALEEVPTATAKAQHGRSTVLVVPLTLLVRLATNVDSSSTRYGGSLASKRVQVLLDMEESSKQRPTDN